jgi:phosphoribosylformylglycinamidine synthase PurS subunit
MAYEREILVQQTLLTQCFIQVSGIPIEMKAKVYVNLKSGVLDPQGKAIQHSVELLGFTGIADVRQGKYFEIALDENLDNQQARESVEKMAREVLSNPIIEDYRVEIEA